MFVARAMHTVCLKT